MPSTPDSRSAFTLTELLVVISLIAILMALSLPVFTTVRAEGEKSKCAANLRQVALAGLSWISDHSGAMPDSRLWCSMDPAEPSSFLPYLGLTNGNKSTTGQTPVTCPTLFRLLGTNNQWNRSYTINSYVCASSYGSTEGQYARQAQKLAAIPSPGAAAFILEGHILNSGVPESKMDAFDINPIWEKRGADGFFAGHGGKANVAFIDGHVESRRVPDDFPSQTNATARRKDPFWGSLQ